RPLQSVGPARCRALRRQKPVEVTVQIGCPLPAHQAQLTTQELRCKGALATADELLAVELSGHHCGEIANTARKTVTRQGADKKRVGTAIGQRAPDRLTHRLIEIKSKVRNEQGQPGIGIAKL